jgi:hypothetical protein
LVSRRELVEGEIDSPMLIGLSLSQNSNSVDLKVEVTAVALVAALAVALSKNSVHLNQAVTTFLTLIPMVHVMEVLDSLME